MTGIQNNNIYLVKRPDGHKGMSFGQKMETEEIRE